MTDPAPPSPQPVQPGPGRGLKIAFALSLALNLLVVGMVAGAWLGGGGPGHGLPRDLSFGPFSEALTSEDRRAIRRALWAERDSFRADRSAAKAEFETLLAALRAEPFDPAAVETALSSVVSRSSARLAKGQEILSDRIDSMSPADRLAFADRLENALRRGGRD